MSAQAALFGAGKALELFGIYAEGETIEAAKNAQSDNLLRRALGVKRLRESETKLITRQARKFKATQESQFISSGASISSGTPLLVMQKQAENLQADLLEHRRSRTIQVQNLRFSAALRRHEGRAAKRASNIKMITGGVGAAGGLA